MSRRIFSRTTIRARKSKLPWVTQVLPRLLVLLTTTFNPWLSYADLDTVPGSRYTSGRGAALGNAFIGLADDGASALFYNPAALGRLRNTHAEPMNLSLKGNSDFTNNLGTGSVGVTGLGGYQNQLSQRPGSLEGVGAAYLPNFSTRGFGLGILAQSEIYGRVTESGEVEYRSKYQLIPAAGFAVRLAKGIVRLGYTFQWVHQASGHNTLASDDSNIGYSQQLQEGNAFSHNAGFALTLPYAYLPALNIVARDVGGTKWKSSSLLAPLVKNSTGTPVAGEMTVDVGLHMMIKLGGRTYANLAFQGNDVTNRSQFSLIGRASAGAELALWDLLFLRGGYSRGYPSAGAGLRSQGGDFSVSWYSEEFGTTYKAERNTIFMLHYQVRAF